MVSYKDFSQQFSWYTCKRKKESKKKNITSTFFVRMAITIVKKKENTKKSYFVNVSIFIPDLPNYIRLYIALSVNCQKRELDEENKKNEIRK